MSLFILGFSVFLLIVALLLMTRPRRFYFIRHGETLLNAEHIRQGPEGSLSEAGKRQAEQVGAFLERRTVTLIISSTFTRARETAEIIQKHVEARLVTSELLAERRNPTEIVGKSTKDRGVTHIVDQMDNAYHSDDYRYADEENFTDLRDRAKKCLTLLVRRGAPVTCVVTHHVFLKMLIAYMLYREHLTAGDFVKLSFFNYSDNAGVTICEYNPLHLFSPTKGWSVLSFNEKPVVKG